MKIDVDFRSLSDLVEYLSIEIELLSSKLLVVYGKGTPTDAHACLEAILSTFLGKPIAYADLQKNFRGKPYLEGTPLHLSLSHTKDAFLLGVSRSQEIGIDLEGNVPPNEIDSLAEYAFSPDERNLLDRFPGKGTFLKIWTLKEAYLKATGMGMIDALPTLHVVSAPHFGITDEQYSCLHFQCPGKETASLVCKGPMPEILSLQLSTKE